jgi:tRNA-2-methylthio-N6-dimethylallyladenosine synthase
VKKLTEQATMPESIDTLKWMERVKNHPLKPSTCCIVTYGCQMNAHDSEILRGMITQMGIAETTEKEEASLILTNTCCVRENAERRALGNITWLKQLRIQNPSLLIGVCGCMMQQEGMAESIIRQYPFVDLAFGTHNLSHFPKLLLQALSESVQTVEVIKNGTGTFPEGLPIKRLNTFQAYITISCGCDNYCSYCVVPYVRGPERSRDHHTILAEASKLAKDGYKEIILLGQNVNSYKSSSNDEIDFPKLLTMLDQTGIPRIRFITSHPKDLTDELINVITRSEHVLKQLHLPVQSGNNDILNAMNRQYTREIYINRIKKLRSYIPDIGITTDLIVGFPGETEDQFHDTLSLVEEIGFDAAFTFIYSARKGTKAALLPGIPKQEETRKRILKLIATQEKQTQMIHQSLVGQTEKVLVENFAKRGQNSVSGKGQRGISISLSGNEQDIGQIIPVRITEIRASTLRGERI